MSKPPQIVASTNPHLGFRKTLKTKRTQNANQDNNFGMDARCGRNYVCPRRNHAATKARANGGGNQGQCVATQRIQWQESVSVSIGDHQAPPRQSLCRYAADGTVLKTPIGEPADDPAKNGGPLRRHMIEEKEEQVAAVGKTVGQYLPPSPDLLLAAFARGNIALVPDQGGPAVVLSDYAKSGDKMKLILDPASMQAIRIDISTYLDKDRSPVAVQVQFARLADNTLYPAQSTISAPEKKILITTANTSYVRVAP